MPFSSPTNFGVGDRPEALAIGDFNGDADPDLVTANAFSGNVSILLGETGFGFTGPTSFGAGSQPESVAVGDFNGDSDPDLAVANLLGDDVSILLGAPGGSFTGPTSFEAGDGPTAVAVGDFDADSDLDLAVTNAISNGVSILLGGAGGSFGAPAFIGVGERPGAVAIGDFNGDSDPDLAAANALSDNVSILLGASGGGFSAPTTFSVGNEPESVAVGDFDDDSAADLAVANASSDDVSILLGGGDGSFGAATDFSAGDYPVSIAIGEFSGDSDPDLAVANLLSENVSILQGADGGGFLPPITFVAGDAPRGVVAGDFNGGPLPDLAVANSGGDYVSILRGQAQPTMSAQATSTATVGQPISDQAILDGGVNPGGSITFQVFGPDDPDCTGMPEFTSAVVVAGNGTYTSASFTPTEAGTYRWSAYYPGNLENRAAAVFCNEGSQASVVTKATPTISASVAPSATIGTHLTDLATLADGADPTGTITFSLYGPDDATCTGTPAFTDTVAVSGNGAHQSADFAPTAVGTYRWTVSYAGDANNDSASTPCGDPNQTVVLGKDSPALSSSASANVTIGGQVSDTATLSSGFDPTGTITFSLYGPDDVTCAGTPAFTDAVTVSGNGSYDSPGFAPTAVGTYRWTASYSGDANNEPLALPCNSSNQSVVVAQAAPTLASDASAGIVIGGELRGTATLSGAFNPTGTITFSLLGPGGTECAGAAAFSDTLPVDGNGTYESAEFVPSAAGEYRWTVDYSGDATNEGASSDCEEETARVTVAKAITTTELTSSRNPATRGEAVAFEATVMGHHPTGTVTFRSGATVLGASQIDGAGKASFTTAALAVGTDEIVATYVGDEKNHQSASAPLSQVVHDPPAPPQPPATAVPSPEVRLTYHPNRPHAPNPKGGPRYTFRFVDSAPGVTFLCRLDKRPFKPCGSPTVYRNLKRGRHVFQVKSVDAAGTESAVQTIRFRAGARR